MGYVVVDEKIGVDVSCKSSLTLIYGVADREAAFVVSRNEHGKHRTTWFYAWFAIAAVSNAYFAFRAADNVELAGRLLAFSLLFLCTDVALLCGPRESGSYRIALAREVLCTAAIVYLGVELGHHSTIMIRGDNCLWLHAYDNRQANNRCPWRMYGLWFIVDLLAVIIGRPRFCLTAVQLSTTLVATVAMDPEKVPVRTAVQWAAISLFHTLFCGFLRYAEELHVRQHFETREALEAENKSISAVEAALRDFTLTIIPKHMHRQLLHDSSDIVADTSTAAIVVTIEMKDIAEFSTSVVPSQAAFTIAAFAAVCTALAPSYNLTLIRHVGDVALLVGRLFDTKCTFQAAVTFALRVVSTRPLGADLACRSAVAVGELAGFIIGVRTSRYDIAGPCLAMANELLQCSTAHHVCVHKREAESLAGQFVFASSPSPTGPALICGVAVDSEGSPISESQFDSGSSHHPLQVAEDSGSVGYIELAATIVGKVKTDGGSRHRDADAGASLATETRCCCVNKYVESSTEEDQAQFRQLLDRKALTVSNAYFAHLSFSLLIMAVVERRRSIDAPITVAAVLLGMCGVGSVILACVTARFGPSPSMRRPMFAANLLSSCVMIVGVSLSRPSMVGDEVGYLTIICAATIVLAGGDAIETVVGQLLLLATFATTSFAFRPLIVIATVITVPLFVLSLASLAANRFTQSQSLYEDTVLCAEALQKQLRLRETREALMEGLIPQQILHRITPESIALQKIDAWSMDDCVVMSISIDVIEAAPPGVPETSHVCFMEWKRKVDSALNAIESAVRAAPHRTLDIVSVSGGRVVVAGPLESAASSSPTIVEAATDATYVLSQLLGSALNLTISVANEQVVNVIRLSNIPSHDLLGPGLLLSRCLLNAAPRSITIVTEKFAALVEREGIPTRSLMFGAAQSWRIKNAGVIRIRTVSAAQEPSPTLPLNSVF